MAEPVDVEVGQLIRVLRFKKGMTQSDLAKQLSISFQQLQKYEKGTNRVSASRLADIANILGVTPGYFFTKTQDIAAVNDPRLAQLIGIYNNLSKKKQDLLLAMAKEL